MSGKAPKSQRSFINATLDRLYHPIDPASLIVVRVAFGLLMAAVVIRFLTTDILDDLYLAQTFRFKYPFLGWLPDPTPFALRATLVMVGICALMMAGGFLYRFASLTFALSWSYVFFQDQTPYQNHDYLICILGFLFALMPLNRTFAVDARLRPSIRAATIPAWCLYALRFQVALVYIFGGVRKINPDWLRGEPIRTMLHTEAFEHAIVGQWFFSETLVMTFAYGGLILDLFIVPALLWRRTRVPAFIVATAFHLTNAWLWDIDMFPWFMIVATLLFFSPSYPRRPIERVRPSSNAGKSSHLMGKDSGGGESRYTTQQKALALALTIHATAQILIPCRPFLNPGHPLEQQDLLVFSWNMMLRLKASELLFIVVDNETGKRKEVAPQTFLSDFQCRARLGSPDMMHQAAQYLAEEERKAGRADVSVYLHGRQSVHARPWQLAYDPEVDLAATPRTLGPKPWVMPFVDPYPPDPTERTAFTKAKWQFCKKEGYLPFTRNPNDEEAAQAVREWERVYRSGKG